MRPARATSRLHFEKRARKLRLTNDRLKSADANLFVVGDRDGDRRVGSFLLHDYVAASPADLSKSVGREKRAELGSGETRSLPSPDLQRGEEDLAMHPGGDF